MSQKGQSDGQQCIFCQKQVTISSLLLLLFIQLQIKYNFSKIKQKKRLSRSIIIKYSQQTSRASQAQQITSYTNYNYLFQYLQQLAESIRIQKMKKEKQVKPKSTKKAQKAKPVTKSTSKSKNKKVQQRPQDLNKAEQTQKIQEPSQLYTVTKQQNKLKIKIHKTYYQDSQPDKNKKITNWISMLNKKQKIKQGHPFKVTGFTYYPTFQFQLSCEKPGEQKCSICQFQFEQLSEEDMQKQLITHNSSDIVMLKCSHILHYECLNQMVKNKDWIRCPVCFTIFGKMIGDQPEGNMQHYVNKLLHCQGYHDCGTIIINYHMYAGKRQNISYPATHRTAYLPDNKQGNQVLQLLKQAFNRKLIFTIGRSVTTGRDNQIVWNGIHHKTNTQGGSAYFGYPDPTYFERVKQQMAAKGVQ